MLRRLRKSIRMVNAFFINDIDEVNAQNWSRLRVLVWVYLAALLVFSGQSPFRRGTVF